jgi:hypothetical protein
VQIIKDTPLGSARPPQVEEFLSMGTVMGHSRRRSAVHAKSKGNA